MNRKSLAPQEINFDYKEISNYYKQSFVPDGYLKKDTYQLCLIQDLKWYFILSVNSINNSFIMNQNNKIAINSINIFARLVIALIRLLLTARILILDALGCFGLWFCLMSLVESLYIVKCCKISMMHYLSLHCI
jgi:hypothetical protein